MCNIYRRPSIDASYQVSDQLALRFQRRRLKCEKLMDNRRQVMAKAHLQFFFFCHFKISFYTAVFPYIVAILEIFKNKKIVYCEIVDLLSNVFVFILLSF
jgi:hypothetical protein